MMKKLCIIDANQKENISFAPGEFGNRCRTCFRNNGMINIFSTKYQDVFLNQMFPMFSFPTITVNDGLPQKVCGACAKILFEFYTFKEKVVQLQPLLNVAAKHLNVVKPVNVTKPGQNFKAQDSGILYNILNENDAGGTAVRKQQDPLSVLCETIKIDDEDDDDSFGGNEEEVENIVICNEDDEDIIENDNEGAEGEVVYEEDYVVQDEEMEETYIKEEEIQISDEILEEQMASEEEVVKEEDEKKDVPKVLYCNPTVFKTIAHHIQTQNQDETLHSFQSDSNEVVNEIVVHGNVIPIPDQLKTALESTEFPRIDRSEREYSLDHAYGVQEKRKAIAFKNRIRLLVRCRLCNRRINKQHIEQHIMMHEEFTCKNSTMLIDSETGSISCDMCNGYFHNKISYLLHGRRQPKSHMLSREGLIAKPPAKYPCDVCGKQYTLTALKEHQNTHMEQKPYMCEQCGDTFSLKSTLSSHMRAHESSTCLCDTCGREFSTPYKLKVHMNSVHLNINSFVCEVCGKGFYHKANLEKHERSHTDEKRYICQECGKGFKQSSHLTMHIKEAHEDDKPFTCDICYKSFSAQYKLTCHKNKHFKEKRNNYTKCSICHKYAKDIDLHMEMHQEGYDYICGFCNDCFILEEDFVTHRQKRLCRQKPKLQFYCEFCGKVFKSNAELLIHRRSHTKERPFECNICHKRFVQNSHLGSHLKMHTGEKDFACSYCGKRFALNGNLKQHVMTHTGERPFSCEYCLKGFMTSSSLKKHKRIHERHLV